VTVAHSHCAGVTRRRCSRADSGIVNSSPETSRGWTTTKVPLLSATPCRTTPAISARLLSSHAGRRAKERMSRTCP